MQSLKKIHARAQMKVPLYIKGNGFDFEIVNYPF